VAPIPPLKETKMTERLETLNKARSSSFAVLQSGLSIQKLCSQNSEPSHTAEQSTPTWAKIGGGRRGGLRLRLQSALRTAPGSQAVLAKAPRVN
jgi:hypothetical protein